MRSIRVVGPHQPIMCLLSRKLITTPPLYSQISGFGFDGHHNDYKLLHWFIPSADVRNEFTFAYHPNSELWVSCKWILHLVYRVDQAGFNIDAFYAAGERLDGVNDYSLFRTLPSSTRSKDWQKYLLQRVIRSCHVQISRGQFFMALSVINQCSHLYFTSGVF